MGQVTTQDTRLSKRMSLALRHEPGTFGIVLDPEGWTSVADLLAGLRRARGFEGVTEADVRRVVAGSDKQRFEIEGERIRARYGHSVPQTVEYEAVEAPETLYHGTSPQAWAAIQREGLRPMGRQYVHLSTEKEQAMAVGRRHAAHPVLLTVRAREAWRAGVRFHRPEPRLYLATAIPPEYVEMQKAEG